MSKKVKVPASRSDILRLYKSLFRAAEQMPTVNREMWVKEKARRDFKLNKDLTDEEDIQTVMAVGLTHLDSVRIQAAHLTRVFNTDWEADLAKTLRKPQHADPDIYSSKNEQCTPQAERVEYRLTSCFYSHFHQRTPSEYTYNACS